jgi:ADP-ribose pyrophosphatase YjhB (NUDIX family)
MFAFRVRATGVLVEDGTLLVLRQTTGDREWSLPGGHLMAGETLAEGVRREIREETGLDVEVGELLYLAEVPEAQPPLLHVTMRVRRRGGEIELRSDADQNPISEVRLVPLDRLNELGFSERFVSLASAGFPNAGSYVGPKANIGL